jgi:hypothetical protein
MAFATCIHCWCPREHLSVSNLVGASASFPPPAALKNIKMDHRLARRLQDHSTASWHRWHHSSSNQWEPNVVPDVILNCSVADNCQQAVLVHLPLWSFKYIVQLCRLDAIADASWIQA